MIVRDDCYEYQFSVTCFFIGSALFLLSPTNKKIRYLTSAFLGSIIFIYPIYLLTTLYWSALSYENKIAPLIYFMNKYAKDKRVYFFSTQLSLEFPAVDYANAIPSSQFPVFSMLPGILKQSQKNNNDKQILKDRDYFINTVASEIKNNKPNLIFVDVQKTKPYMEELQFEYLNYLSQNANFKHNWQDYHYLTTIESYPLYKLAVYERPDDSEKP